MGLYGIENESMTDLYEIENLMTINHLGFDFTLVEGLANQSGGIPFRFAKLLTPPLVMLIIPRP